jgi:PKD repeat protein
LNGTLTIWVEVDHLDEYVEQNETNNRESKQLVINSFPYGIELKISNDMIYRGQRTELFVNVSDIETTEDALNCSIMYYHDSIGTWTEFPSIEYISGRWYTKFDTVAATNTGQYDVMISVTDVKNASIDIISNDAFEVLNNDPLIGDAEISRDLIFRTQNFTINFSTSDFEDIITKDNIKIELYLQGSGSDWFEINGLFNQLAGSGNDWQFLFTSNKTIAPGIFDIRVSVTDNDNARAEVELLDALEIKNNLPVIERITIYPNAILRREFVTISIYGFDLETAVDDIEVDLEFRLAFESVDWASFSKPVVVETHWEAVFYSNVTTLTGNYSFRARIKDNDNEWTEHLPADSELMVMNNPPEAIHTFKDNLHTANEDEPVFFDAFNSTDIEDNFCSAFIWDFGDGNSSELSRISHIYKESGTYNVTLTVFDKNLGTDSTSVSIKILNVDPTANIIVDKIQALVGEAISFDGMNSTDTESDTTNLNFFWDFNDGTTSTLPKVVHVFSSSGTFMVTLNVTDDDGSVAKTDIYITVAPTQIKKKDDPEKESDLFFNLMIIVMIIIIIAIIAGVAFATRIKRKNKLKQKKPLLPGDEADAEPEVEEPVQTLVADIEDIPEFAATPYDAAGKVDPTTGLVKGGAKPDVAAGLTVKPKSMPKKKDYGLGTTPTQIIDSEPQYKLPPQRKPKMVFDIEPEPEIEIESVPELKTIPSSMDSSSVELDSDVLDSINLPDSEVEEVPDVVLPPTSTDLEPVLPGDTKISEDDIGEPTGIDTEPAEVDIDFVPPKIDIPIIPEQMQEPINRPEIEEAQKRGEGVSLSFKRPDKKKK